MTKEDVKQSFKGNGKDIALAMSQYFTEKIKEGKIKPLEFYKSGDFQNKPKKEDTVTVAEQIFLV